MSEETPETIPRPPGTRGAKALAPGERVTAKNALSGMKAVLASVFKKPASGDGHAAILDGGTVKRPEMADAARLIRDFLADPERVLRGGLYGMTASNAFVKDNFKDAPRLVEKVRNDSEYYFYEQRSNATVHFYETHPTFPGVHNIEVVAAEAESAVRVQLLPWREAKLTYCKLDDSADLVLTGPINGCSVHLVKITGRDAENGTYLFHVNANETGLKGREAAEAQGRKLDAALDLLWPDASERTVTHRLTSNDYRSTVEGTQVNGFVYGARSRSGEWAFSYYFIDFGPTGRWTKRDSMPEPLPRA